MQLIPIMVEEHIADSKMARRLRIRAGKTYGLASLPNGTTAIARNRYLSIKYLSRLARIDQSRFLVQLTRPQINGAGEQTFRSLPY